MLLFLVAAGHTRIEGHPVGALVVVLHTLDCLE